MRGNRERWHTSAGWTKKGEHDYFAAFLEDDNFVFDASLEIRGDFGGEIKGEYAQVLADALNAVPAMRKFLEEAVTLAALVQGTAQADKASALLAKAAKLYPTLRECPEPQERRAGYAPEQQEFSFRFNWTEEEQKERDAHAEQIKARRRSRRSGESLDDFVAKLTPEVRAAMRRRRAHQQLRLNWD